MPRAIDWRRGRGRIAIVDQTLLPERLEIVELAGVDELVDAIQRLAVRGAPALGVAGALGVALAVRQAEAEGWSPERLAEAISALRGARPTAVNLAWGVDQVVGFVSAGAGAVEEAAVGVLEAEVEAQRRLASRGADLLTGVSDRPMRLQTHCNTGALACVEWGTALGIARALHERGRVAEVLVGETRPLLQGARLTTWELGRLGIPHRLICDSAGPAIIASGIVDVVVVGADRIAANGDVANKVGTYALALAAARSEVPFVVAAPESTLDAGCASGAEIEVELRDEREVTELAGRVVAPAGTRALNVAFDVTPAELVSAVVTEERVAPGGRGWLYGDADGADRVARG